MNTTAEPPPTPAPPVPTAPVGGRAFVAPSPEQVARLLDRHRPRPMPASAMWGPLFALAAVLALMLTLGHQPWAMPLPWLLLLALLVHGWVRADRQRRLERDTTLTQDLAMTRHYPAALRRAWKTLPAAVHRAEAHGRILAAIAYCLDQMGRYDAALVAYDRLAQRTPADHPAAMQLQAHRAVCLLQTDQLADGDDALRRLRGLMAQPADTAPQPAAALAHFATLVQMARTHHFRDADALADHALDRLRPLGCEAGFGFALLALAYRQLAELRGERHHAEQPPSPAPHDLGDSAPGVDQPRPATDPAVNPTTPPGDDRLADARAWWHRATTLLPVDAILARFPETAALAADLPAADRSVLGLTTTRTRPEDRR